MTFKELVVGYLMENGMFESQAEKVFQQMTADQSNNPMDHRWNDDVNQYPQVMQALAINSARRSAKTWIAQNAPEAWFRMVFD